MMNDQLIEYIAAERARGVADPLLRDILLDKGWLPEDVTAALSGEGAGSANAEYSGKFSFGHLYDGRVGRWDCFFAQLLLGLFMLLLCAAAFFFVQESYGITLGTIIPLIIFFLVLFVLSLPFSLSLAVRRLHDIGVSGWFVLLALIPMINVLLWLALLFWPGDPRGNAYGITPTGRSFMKTLLNT